MAIQLRSGAYENFDPTKLMQGEVAIVVSGDPNTEDGKALYVCFGQGDVERMSLSNDLDKMKNLINYGYIHICTESEYNSETGVPTVENPDTRLIYFVKTNSHWDGWLATKNGEVYTWNHVIEQEPSAVSSEQIDAMLGGETIAGDQQVTADSLQHFWVGLQQEMSTGNHAHTPATVESNGFMSAQDKIDLNTCVSGLSDIQKQLRKPGDLTVLFADEIAEYDDEWAWFSAEVQAGHLDKFKIGDYIDVTLTNNKVMRYQIGKMNPDCIYQDDSWSLRPHVAMVPANVCINILDYTNVSGGLGLPWLKENSQNPSVAPNNYKPIGGSAYLQSNLQAWETQGFMPLLPAKVKNVILDRTINVESRAATSDGTIGAATNTTAEFTIWSPSEIEVFGRKFYANDKTQQINDGQFPIFSNPISRTRGASFEEDTQKLSWWLRNVDFDSVRNDCCVSTNGYASTHLGRDVVGNLVDNQPFPYPLPCFLV